MAKVRPIRPSQVAKRKKIDFPDAVFEAFNELIVKNCSAGGYAVVMQNEVVALMVHKGLERKKIYENHWLDVEDVYRSAGWRVEYDRPGYNEDYEPSFKFEK